MSLGTATRSEPARGLAPGGEPVPGFRLVRRLGAGGSGEVWEAIGPGGFPVALKVAPLGGPRTAAHLRGLEIARAVRHPNLLANFGAWIDDERLVLAMELADGSLWDRFLKSRGDGRPGIPRDDLLDALAEAARGVDFLNEPRHSLEGRTGLGIQHRDLKPQNILLVGGGVKVADFGASRWMDGPIAGHAGAQWTPAYAPPEFFLGATARQSDQYSLAVTYHHLRTGRLPFPATPGESGAGHLFRDPDLALLDEAERPAVARALARNPDDRWPTCRAFVAALRDAALAADEPAGPPPARTVARASLVWPDRVVASLAEAAPAVTYATGPLAAHDPADDSLWDGPRASEYDTIDSPWPHAPADDPPPLLDAAEADADGPRPRRRWGLALASLAAAAGLAAWLGGAFATPPRRPAVARGPATPARVAHRVARPVNPDPAPPSVAPEPPPSIPGPIRPPFSLAKSAELPTLPTAPPVLAPAATLARAEAGPSPGRALARFLLPMIANPTLPHRFETLAVSPTPEVAREAPSTPAEATPPIVPRRAAPELPPALEAGGVAESASVPKPTTPAPTLAESARRRAVEHLVRGEALLKGGDPARALVEFDAALVLWPDSPAALSDRGLCRMRQGDVLRALGDIDAALKLAPDSAVIHYNRGVVYSRLGDAAQARASYDAALRLDPALELARAARDLLAGRQVALTRGGSPTTTPAPPPPARPTLAGAGR